MCGYILYTGIYEYICVCVCACVLCVHVCIVVSNTYVICCFKTSAAAFRHVSII